MPGTQSGSEQGSGALWSSTMRPTCTCEQECLLHWHAEVLWPDLGGWDIMQVIRLPTLLLVRRQPLQAVQLPVHCLHISSSWSHNLAALPMAIRDFLPSGIKFRFVASSLTLQGRHVYQCIGTAHSQVFASAEVRTLPREVARQLLIGIR